ncbi:glycosyltransferase family 2 protein [Nocardioides marmoriginsengisoli]|uniref:Glycosyltransferase family 2 protein n=1 Tax=Nocardioides marmoriginsengisoli TaxID=661483 RepID=A0A3N0CMG3_9ACTN|nr:glycosyltransferase family 2 protein [Nocardioides marmoriginsengisoli]RNL64246.1 glycosyltransferase family 2 protein [Nocardioides marmoriginsengisoli]
MGNGGSYDDVCVIVPVYNEATTIADVVVSLRARFADVVCVDDGSSDESAAIARAAGATVVRHAINQGQGAALQTGFDHVLRNTDATYVVTFDADGQHVVEDAVRMVDTARAEGVDVVLASRFTGTSTEMPAVRRLVLKAGTGFTRWSAKLEVTDTHNGLRVLNRTALRRIRLTMPRMAYASELLSAIVPNGLSYTEVSTTVNYTEYSRAKGQTNLNAVNILFDLAVRRMRAS